VGYWTDKLPEQLNSYNCGFIVGVVNTIRSTKGVSPLLDVNTAQVNPGWEDVLEGYGYKYNIDFVDMRYTNGFAVGWRSGSTRLAGRSTAEDMKPDG
jgi:hypothetical protein